MALATELEAKDNDSWAPGREEYIQALMQEVGKTFNRISVSDLIPEQIDAFEQLFQQWYLIPGTAVLTKDIKEG